MKLFQKLINLLNKCKSTLIKCLLSGKEINLTGDNVVIKSNNLNVNEEGEIDCSNININGGNILLKGRDVNNGSSPSSFVIETDGEYSKLNGYSNEIGIWNKNAGVSTTMLVGDANSSIELVGSITASGNGGTASLEAGNKTDPVLYVGKNGGNWSYVYPSYMKSNEFRNSSLKELKKNIQKLDIKAIGLIKYANICEYNFKTESDDNKKHLGLIIGEGYNCPDLVISEDGQGVEQYSMTSVAWKAIQELIEQNEQLMKRIETIEKEVQKNELYR